MNKLIGFMLADRHIPQNTHVTTVLLTTARPGSVNGGSFRWESQDVVHSWIQDIGGQAEEEGRPTKRRKRIGQHGMAEGVGCTQDGSVCAPCTLLVRVNEG
jgi:hypothetical protein